MKQKYIYIAFVIATILVLFLINRKTPTKTSTVVINKIPQEISLQQNLTPQAQLEPGLPRPGKPRITIVKKANPNKENILPEAKKAIITPEKKETPAAGSYAVSGEETSSLSTEEKPAPGVTKVGQRPSQQTVNELNEQGIILY